MQRSISRLLGISLIFMFHFADAQTNLTVTICSGQSYSVGNNNFNTTGMYQTILVGSNGLDSIVNLNLTVLPPVVNNVTATICSGQSYYVGNFTYSSTGQYMAMLVSPAGCDSIVNLDLTVLPPVQNSVSATICSGNSYYVGNFTYSTTGQYQALLLTPDGCDSIIDLDLTVLPPIQNNLTKVICAGQTYQFGNTVYSTSGQYQNLFVTPGGCDSIVNLDLTVLPPIQNNLTKVICAGQTYQFGNTVYSTSGQYQNQFVTPGGCDSIVNLDLTVLPPLQQTLNATVCNGASYMLGDSVYSVSGTYKQVFTSFYGCDSTVTLNLTVLPPVVNTLTESICQGQSFALGDSTYSMSGNYQELLLSTNGCDSLIALNLTVLPPIQSQIDAAICEGETYSFGDSVYSVSGDYQQILTTATGCDSIIMLHLTTTQAMIVTSQSISPVCAGQTGEITLDVSGGTAPYLYSLDGILYQDQPSFFNLPPGTYTLAVQDSNGCTATLADIIEMPAVLSLAFPDSIISIVSGDSITLQPSANFTVDTFYWQPATGLDCPDCWEPVAKPEKSTVYQLFAYSEDGCEVMAALRMIVKSSRRIYIPNIFKPDRDGLNDTFSLYSDGQVEQIVQMHIYDRWGNELFADKNLTPNTLGSGWDGRYKGKPMSPGVYIYYFEVLFKDGSSHKYSGDVTLVR